jgi:hypothetical protein
MPPANTSMSPTDVDNEATAELPVLDVATYEATLADHTDTWVAPTAPQATGMAALGESTMEMPSLPSLPTLTPAYDLDHSGTHEMPAMLSSRKALKPATVPVAAATPTEPVPSSASLIEDWRNALANAERRIEELVARARIADAERAVAIARANAETVQLREQLAAHQESLHTARQRSAVHGADLPQLEDQLFARGDRIAALEKEVAAQAATLADRAAQLEASRQLCEKLDCDARNLRASVARRDTQIAILEADMLARQQREAQLTSRLSDALASTDPFVPQLRSEIHVRDEQIRLLKLDLDLARVQTAEKDHDLQVAEESIRNLEIDLRDKTGKLEEASGTVEEWRAVIAESQRSILQRDGRIKQLETDLEKRTAMAVDSAAQTGEEVALEGPARVLIRTSGNTDYVHVLGRRTRIGRGSDNELVLDTKHISRYHAVLLAGPVHTSIEDLNSTNGVFVNGKRVARQVLKDGDRLTIGRTQFRYSVRD